MHGPGSLGIALDYLRAHPAEVLATITGIANVALLVRRNIWNYPFGLVCVALYAWVFFGARLYSDALLQLFFFAIQLYGWWAWARAGGATEAVPVGRLTGPARAAWGVVIVIVSLAWGSGMAAGTDAAFPWWDGTVAVASIAAQILLARRKIENWVLWILVDLSAIGLYFAKQLYITSGLYLLFLILAMAGLLEWRLAMRQARHAGP